MLYYSKGACGALFVSKKTASVGRELMFYQQGGITPASKSLEMEGNRPRGISPKGSANSDDEFGRAHVELSRWDVADSYFGLGHLGCANRGYAGASAGDS